MSKIDELYDKAIKDAVGQINVDRKELAESRLMLFSSTVFHLISEKKIHYDAIISGGNSGSACIELTKIIYEIANVDCPPTFTIPVVRYKSNLTERFDNSSTLPYVKTKTETIKRLKKVLFVDDEIRIGFTAKTCVELVGKAIGQNFISNPITVDIVAENHLFAWQHDLPGVVIRFFPHALVFFGYNNNLSYLPSSELKSTVNDLLGREVNINQLLSTLFTGVMKNNDETLAWWDESLEKELSEKLENYVNIKTDFRSYVSNIILQGIESYKKGELKLRLYT